MSRSWRLKTAATIGLAALVMGIGMAAHALRPPQAGRDGGDRSWTKPVPVSPGLSELLIEVGLKDRTPQNWTGEVLLSKGRVLGGEIDRGGGVNATVEGQRFMARTPNYKAKKKEKRLTSSAPARIVVRVDAPDDATATIRTNKGMVEVALADLLDGATRTGLDGQVSVSLRPGSTVLTGPPTEDGYPAAAVGPDGSVWMAFTAYTPHTFKLEMNQQPDPADFDEVLIPEGNGDRIHLARYADGSWQPPVDVTDGLRDLWRPAVAVDGDGAVHVAWAEQRDDNFDIYRRSYDPEKKSWSDEVRVTDAPGTDTNVVAATDGEGTVWLAWQGWRDGDFDILARPIGDGDADERIVSDSDANDWSPSIASAGGKIHIAWDTYDQGNYDVRVRALDGSEPVTIAGTARYEARPHLAADKAGRLWIAYELGDEQWGKDYSTGQFERIGFDENPGFALYINRTVRVACLTPDGAVKQPAADLEEALRPLGQRSRSVPRLAVSGDGSLWLTFRHDPEAGVGGEVWVSSVTRYDGDSWSGPVPVAGSEGLMDNRPAMAPEGDGLLMVFSGDRRTRTADREQADLYTSRLDRPGRAADPELVNYEPAPPQGLDPVHPDEKASIARIRDYRIDHGGKQLRLLRGEFHRHTEVTAHNDGDGTLEDTWRYALDAADHDWMGNGDHHNGFGYEYMWWYIQKMTDMMHHAPRFVAAVTYERSAVYPNGHRNVMFARRGIRPLPFGQLQGTPEEGTPDTKVLYEYLRHFGGICAVHTSATNMGTDWRDNASDVEPVVEIYQGHRHNYEHFAAPRSPTEETQIGGYRPAGFVWNALEKGYRLGFQSSSDHISTHWSYAIVLTDDASRQGIIDAFKQRHSYAATDNIILDVRSGEHLMGDEFSVSGRPEIEVKVQGTSPIKELHVVRDNRHVFTTVPGATEASLTYTDEDRGLAPGTHYYYIRIEQEDGNLAWSSPMWIDYQPEGSTR